MPARRSSWRLLGLGSLVVWVGCTQSTAPTPSSYAVPPALKTVAPEVFVGAGDIGHCGSPGPALTAALLDTIGGTVFAAGDNAYTSGTADEYERCYEPSWGRHRARTRPTPGNHDYESSGAFPYYSYFGEQAGPAGRGYYSFELGAWHIVSLNSNVAADTGSAQVAWLRDDLGASTAACTLAYWHHPLFSTGQHGNDKKMLDVFRTLYDAHADVVVTGHDHDYERFAPLTPEGVRDAARGIREFVVGTGGHADLRGFPFTSPNSEVRDRSTWGVLKFTLRADAYDWEFVPAGSGTFRDAGTGSCVR